MKQINRILIIDDDETTCFLQNRLLQDMGVAQEIEYITDATKALNHINEKYLQRP